MLLLRNKCIETASLRTQLVKYTKNDYGDRETTC